MKKLDFHQDFWCPSVGNKIHFFAWKCYPSFVTWSKIIYLNIIKCLFECRFSIHIEKLRALRAAKAQKLYLNFMQGLWLIHIAGHIWTRILWVLKIMNFHSWEFEFEDHMHMLWIFRIVSYAAKWVVQCSNMQTKKIRFVKINKTSSFIDIRTMKNFENL